MENPNRYLFTHCPSCGSKSLRPRNDKSFNCTQCHFLFYMNCAAAAMGLITNAQGQLLVTRRKKDPAAGTLDFPGGFIEPGESAEEGLKREIKEELNLNVSQMDYLTSAPNTYLFKDVEYAVTDLAFLCKIDDFTPIQADDDVDDFFFMDVDKINPDDFGLDSPKKVIRRYQQFLSQQG